MSPKNVVRNITKKIKKEADHIYPLLDHRGIPNSVFISAMPYRIASTLTRNNIKLKKVNVLGHQMFLDSNDSLKLAWKRVYEPYETSVMQALIKPGDTVIDLGAFIGYYTLVFARAVGPRGRVFAFEPDPSNFGLLKHNVELNKYSNVILEQRAIGDIDGKSTLYLCDENRGMNRIYKSAYCNKQIEVESVKLDSYFKDSRDGSKIDFIKMDLEGAEYGALTSMGTLLTVKGLKIVMEFHPPSIIEYGQEPKRIIDLLNRYNFEVYCLDPISRTKQNVNVFDPTELVISTAKYPRNLLCIKR